MDLLGASQETSLDRLRNARADSQAIVVNLGGEHGPEAVEQRELFSIACLDLEVRLDDGIFFQLLVNLADQRVETFPGAGGNSDLRGPHFKPAPLGRPKQVDLVPNVEPRRRGDPQFYEKAFDGRVLLISIGLGGIGDVKKQACALELFERRAERGHEVCGQLAKKPDRVGEQDGTTRLKRESPDGRIEGRKEPPGSVDRGPGQRVEERGLAGVGVTDQGNGEELAVAAMGAVERPLRPHALDGLPQSPDARPHAAAVVLEFLLARAARSNSAAEPREERSAPAQAWQQVGELRQFNLELPLAAARAPGKNIEDQLSAVEDLHVE